jgi:hypothetical protein
MPRGAAPEAVVGLVVKLTDAQTGQSGRTP